MRPGNSYATYLAFDPRHFYARPTSAKLGHSRSVESRTVSDLCCLMSSTEVSDKMYEQPDLDEIAEAYLSVGTLDRLEYARLLLRAGSKAVLPLLGALLSLTLKYKHNTDRIARAWRGAAFGEEGGRYIWAKATFEPEVRSAYDVIRRMGQPAKTELCRALLSRNYRIRLGAALLLSMDEKPSSETKNAIQESLSQLADPSQSLILMLLGIVMFQAGDDRWKQAIESHACGSGVNLQEWMERTRNTALIELQSGS